MTHSIWLRPAAALFAISLVSTAVPANAAGLQPGEYMCVGSSGILIGLGFKLKADGSYTDLDGKSSGKVVFQGSGLRFVGGHLDGEVGRNVRGNAFETHGITCSHA